MRLPMVDCRSLIEFCKEFEQHRNISNSLGVSDHHRTNNNIHSRGKKHNNNNSLNALAHPFCEHSPPFAAAIDIVLLLLVLGAVSVLTVPYFKFIFEEASDFLPEIRVVIRDAIRNAPVPYVVSFVAGFGLVIALWEILNVKARKCGKPYCKGLRKAVEFDIQLESEQCVKYLPSLPSCAYGMKPLELGEDHKELEAELKKMAPPNGRTVLIFRSPCGCPLGRMEVWGPKKLRRIKK